MKKKLTVGTKVIINIDEKEMYYVTIEDDTAGAKTHISVGEKTWKNVNNIISPPKEEKEETMPEKLQNAETKIKEKIKLKNDRP